MKQVVFVVVIAISLVILIVSLAICGVVSVESVSDAETGKAEDSLLSSVESVMDDLKTDLNNAAENADNSDLTLETMP